MGVQGLLLGGLGIDRVGLWPRTGRKNACGSPRHHIYIGSVWRRSVVRVGMDSCYSPPVKSTTGGGHWVNLVWIGWTLVRGVTYFSLWMCFQ